jgi:hypothetical protein
VKFNRRGGGRRRRSDLSDIIHVEAQWHPGPDKRASKSSLSTATRLQGLSLRIKAGIATRIGGDERRIRRFIAVAGIAEYYARHNPFRSVV